jgi:hypothetical protein
MAVSMQTNLMSSIPDRRHIFWKCFQTVSRDEPRGFDVVFCEQFQEALRADGASKKPATDVACTIFSAV